MWFSVVCTLIDKDTCFSECELKKARHIDASSVVWTLIDNGKLANQMARLGNDCGKWTFDDSTNKIENFLRVD